MLGAQLVCLVELNLLHIYTLTAQRLLWDPSGSG